MYHLAHLEMCFGGLSFLVHHLFLLLVSRWPAVLGVQEVVPTYVSHRTSYRQEQRRHSNINIPLGGPLHDVVAGNKGRSPVQDLPGEPPPGVEDGVVTGTGERVLAVGGNAERDNAALLLGCGACARLASVLGYWCHRIVVSSCCQYIVLHRIRCSVVASHHPRGS